jgi:AcrR family transcriptional regulator
MAAPTTLPLPRGRAALPPEVVEASQRRRLLEAMTELAAGKGLDAVTVADLTAHAGVGRKSFYALFTDKTDCYLAAFKPNARALLDIVRGAIEAADDPVAGLLDSYRVYLRLLAAQPVSARAYLLEGMRGGPEVIAVREQVHAEFVELTRATLARAHRAVSEHSIVALVGGVNELVCRELDRPDGAADVAALEPHVIDLVVAVLRLETSHLQEET